MSASILQNRLQKNTHKKRKIFFLCYLASLAFSVYQGTILLNNSIEFFDKKQQTQKKQSLFNILSPLITTGLWIFITRKAFKLLNELFPNKLREISVSPDVLQQLCYVKHPPQNTPSIYDPLTENDIKNLTTYIDFSHLKKSEQQFILQDLIITSYSSPFVAKLLKSKIRAATLFIDKNLYCAGISDFAPEIDVEGKIILQNFDNPLVATHEIFHLKQAQDGSYCLKNLNHYLHLINEAQAQGLNYILNYEITTECQKRNPSDSWLSNWEKTLYTSQLQKAKKQHPLLSERELKGKTEEMSIGILMKCLLESDKKLREEIFVTTCGSFSSKTDKLNFNTYCLNWRKNYINEDVLKRENELLSILKHTPSIIQHEVNMIPDFNAYFTAETGIPQDIRSIKISKQKPTALFQFTQHLHGKD
ncbi:MAG: hypothetical protein IJY92_07350 [Alphaproteobacteria bacterium]|nr:hypothetical protein [Alphaproteobacteria bacterium]